jgi:putative ABC transport system permease protein
MKLAEIVKIAHKNIFLAKIRSLLTILSIIVGSTTLTFAIGVGFGVNELVDSQLESQRQNNVIQIFPKDPSIENEEATSQGPIPEYQPNDDFAKEILAQLRRNQTIITPEQLSDVQKRNEIEQAYPVYQSQFLYLQMRNQKLAPRFVVRYPSFDLNMRAGKQEISDAQVILSEEFAEQFGVSPQDLIGERILIAYPKITDTTTITIEEEFEVAGIKASGLLDNGALVYTTYNTNTRIARSQGAVKNDVYRQVVLQLRENLTEEERDTLRLSLEKEFDVFDIAQTQDAVSQLIIYLTVIMAGFAGIVLLASVFGIANTMLMSVFERTQQIGLMKALGMQDKQVFFLFALEGVMIGFWGAVVGILLSIGSSKLIINPFLYTYFTQRQVEAPLQLIFPIKWLFLIIIFLMTLAFVATVLPSKKASKVSPIKALRYE